MNILIYDVDCSSSGVDYPLAVAFEKMGHKTYMFDWGKFLFTHENASLLNRLKDKLLFEITAFRINRNLRSLIRKGKFDLFLVVRGDHIYPSTIEDSKLFLSSVVNWNSDDLFNKFNTTKYIIGALDKYDVHFSPRPHLKNDYLSHGVKRFETLNWYYRLGLLNEPGSILETRNYNHEITFVGSWSEKRQYYLQSLVEHQLNVCGWGWKKYVRSDEYKRWTFSNPIKMVDMTKMFATSKININLLTAENRDTSNHRNFEIPAAGGFQLSEWSEHIIELFKEDVEIVCFKNREELVDKCKFYLKNDSLRERIALAGYNRLISSGYTLENRLQTILDTVI